MRIGRLLSEHKQEILARWRGSVGKKLAGDAVDRAALEGGWSAFLDALAERFARTAAGEDEGAPLNLSALGAGRLALGYAASEIVREAGLLHGAVAAIAGEHGCVCDAGEWALLVRWFYAALATAVGEHSRRRDADLERETVEQLGGLARDLDTDGLRRIHALAESRGSWQAAPGHERFSLASVLAAAIGELHGAAAERNVSVLVDLAAPLEIDGARDLLRRAIVRVLGSAIGATRRGGSVSVRAQALSGARVRIDIHDECCGGGLAPAGHFLRPALALQRSAADWSIVRRAIAANRGTVHARRLAGVGCLVTIDVPGIGEEEPCCDGDAPPAPKPPLSARPPAERVELRDRVAAVADQLRRVVDEGTLDRAPPSLRARLMSSVGELATRAGVDELAVARAERVLVELYRNVTATTTSSCVSTFSKRS